MYQAAGKPITQVNIDEGASQAQAAQFWLRSLPPVRSDMSFCFAYTDLTDNEKPWRKPGTDISDYFNYGFDEFTWALYAAKQEAVRGEFGAEAFAANNKKMMDEFNSMMMGGMGGAGGGAGGMPGMDGMAPEMQAMMQQMMTSGMDPTQMDPSQMNAMFAGMQNAGAHAGAQGIQGHTFGGGMAGAQGAFGYEQNMGAGGAGGAGAGGKGGFGGGRGRRGRW